MAGGAGVQSDADGLCELRALRWLWRVRKAFKVLQRKDRFEFTDTDRQELEQQFPLETGQFLVDGRGIVRWVNLELARDGLAAMGKFPTDEELLQVVRAHGV